MHEFVMQTVSVLLVSSLIIIIFAMAWFRSLFIKILLAEVLINVFLAGVAFWALHQGMIVYVDLCLPLALITFLSVVAYYQLLTRTGYRDI